MRRRWSSASSTLPVTFSDGEQRQLDDVPADLLPEARVLGLELLAVLLQPHLEVGVRLLARLLELALCLAAGLLEDLLAVGLRLLALARDLLTELTGLRARLVGLVERLADAVAALVDQPLDASEGEAPQHAEDDQERDDRPDHQARDDVDQRALVLLGRGGRLLGEEERLYERVPH